MSHRSRKIRFIEPGTRPGRPFNAWIAHWPLLGPIVLATILDRQGYDVAIYNENISGPLDANPSAQADICSADVVGITTMTATANRAYQLARLIKEASAGTTIVFGGAHATFLPDEAIQYGDVVVCGEAENIIEHIASGDIREGIIHPDKPENLDDLPPLKHDLMMDFDRLIATSGRRALYELPVMTSRGCPHGCMYCSVTRMFGRKVRRQSTEKVEADLKVYHRRGFRRVFFYDDNLTSDREWTKELLSRIKPLGIRWNAQARVDMHWVGARRAHDEEMLQAMKTGGGDVLYIGYETIDEQTAKQWNKGYRGKESLAERLYEDTQTLHECGFWIHGMFMLGPEHDENNLEQVVRFASKAGIESIQISVLTPLPGTPLFQQMQDNLLFTNFPADWNYYDGTHCVYHHHKMGIAGLQQAVINAHKKFYRMLHPGLRRIAKLSKGRMHLSDRVKLFWRHAKMSIQVMKQWQEETNAFLSYVREKGQRYLFPTDAKKVKKIKIPKIIAPTAKKVRLGRL